MKLDILKFWNNMPAGNPGHAALYAAAGLGLLSAGLAGFIYWQNLNVSQNLIEAETAMSMPVASGITVAQQAIPDPASGIASAVSSNAASGVAVTGTSGITPSNLPATASGPHPASNWTHPLRPHKKQATPAPAPKTDELNLAYTALLAGMLDEAENKYRQALLAHPHEKDALLGLAIIAQRNRQYERAARLYRQVLREDIGNAPAAAALVSLSATADPVAAESQVRELIDIKPAAPQFHYALGNILAPQSRWGEAQQSFYRAWSLAPDNALYTYNLAVSLDRLHQTKSALPYYEKSRQEADTNMLDRKAIEHRMRELGAEQP